MSSLLADLARFSATGRDDWRRDVEKALKGRSFDAALVKRTPEGLTVAPLYTREDLPAGADHEVPGQAPFARGFAGSGTEHEPRRGWTRGALIEHPDAVRANAQLLADLDGGIERATVRVASARALAALPAAASQRASASGRGGVWIDSGEDVATALSGVMWSMAPVAILPPADNAFTAKVFAICAELGGRHGDGLSAQADVVGLAHGASDSQWLAEVQPHIAADTGRAAAATLAPLDARPLWVSAAGLRAGGADLVQELATALAAFVAMLRGLDLEPAAVLRATEFHFAVGSDFFSEIAKLRAFRRSLGLILETVGLAGRTGDALVTATTAEETLTRRDVHVNLLRATAQASAAVLGGADCVIVQPFDSRLHGGSPAGRRLARNIHSLLQEESHLDAVTDPGGGSFYIEQRTEQLAEAAWRQFVEWERAGGFVAVARGGVLAQAIRARRQQRDERLRTRRDAVLGVSVYPQPRDTPSAAPERDAAAFVDQWRARLGVAAAPASVAVDPEPASPYLGDAFEDLRDDADALTGRGTPPVVYAALFGAPLAFAVRLDWVRDVLTAGGIQLVEERVPEDQPGEAAQGLAASGAHAAIIIAPDALHEAVIPAAAAALRAAGLTHVLVAGKPGPLEAAHREAGVTDYVFAGSDATEMLRRLLNAPEPAHGRS